MTSKCMQKMYSQFQSRYVNIGYLLMTCFNCFYIRKIKKKASINHTSASVICVNKWSSLSIVIDQILQAVDSISVADCV